LVERSLWGPPAITGLRDVSPYDVAPRDKGDKKYDHETSLDIGCGVRSDLMRAPQGKCECEEVDHFPSELKEEQRDHLDGIAESHGGDKAQACEQGELDTAAEGKIRRMLNNRGPDDKPEPDEKNEVTKAESVKPDKRKLVQGNTPMAQKTLPIIASLCARVHRFLNHRFLCFLTCRCG
jgi:hypothetical protein